MVINVNHKDFAHDLFLSTNHLVINELNKSKWQGITVEHNFRLDDEIFFSVGIPILLVFVTEIFLNYIRILADEVILRSTR